MNTIKIISESQDLITDLVMEYLTSTSRLVIREDDESFVEFNLQMNECGEVLLNGQLKETVYWIRRGTEKLLPFKIIDNKIGANALRYLHKESMKVSLFVEQHRRNNGLTSYGSVKHELHTNKIQNLHRASKCGLVIPNTCISNQKVVLSNFIEKFKSVVFKDIHSPVSIVTKEGVISSNGVDFVTVKDLDGLNSDCYPTMLQEYIDKKFEIRVFIFGKKCFAMAIFSQADPKTAVDFRNYNEDKPNRCVPFNLDKSIEEKLIKFMTSSNLDTGSIDLIYSTSDQYVFLEVNPMGQFHWLSKNCNYYIEKFIAEKLTI